MVFLTRTDFGGSVPGWLMNQIASEVPMTVERLNSTLQRTSDLSIYDKPLPDVLLFGPRNTPIINGQNVGDSTESNGLDPHHHVMGNGVDSTDLNQNSNKSTFRYPQMSEDQKQRLEQIIRENDGDFFASKEYLDLIPDDPEWIQREPVFVNGMEVTEQHHNRLLDRFTVPDAPFKYKKDVEAAVELFKEWRSWKDGVEWTFKTQKERYVPLN